MIPTSLKQLFGAADCPQAGQLFRATIRVQGWVLARAGGDVGIEILVDGQPVAVRIRREIRPDVHRACPWARRRQPVPGFWAELPVETLAPGAHTIAVWAEASGRRALLAQRTCEIEVPGTGPAPLLFVHIPKTAGTSLVAELTRHYPTDAICLNVENLIREGSPEEVRLLSRFDLVSAHLEFETLERLLAPSRFTSLSVFREPEQQLVSHLGWIRQLGDPDRDVELAAHPGYIRAAVARIDRLGLAGFLDTLTDEERRLLDNCQARYLLPQATVSAEERHLESALARLQQIDLVGVTEKLDDLLLLVAFKMRWNPPRQTPRLNMRREKSPKDSEAVSEALATRMDPLTRLDKVVYAAAAARFQRQFDDMLVQLRLDGVPDPKRTRLRAAIESASQRRGSEAC